jgi:hypothetical protein
VKAIKELKPGAGQQTHLITAALIWSVVGTGLLIFGIRMLLCEFSYFMLAAALVAGTLKGYFVLQRSAEKNIARIRGFTGATCLGAVFSAKMWVLVLIMAGSGRWLRLSSGVSPGLIGFLYAAVGWALLFSSRLLWQEWSKK